MITVHEADKIIAENMVSFPVIEKPLPEAYGAILQEEIKADRDLPPFNKSLMDGIAVKLRAWKEGKRSFPITGLQPAGQAGKSLTADDSCVEIMTGAVVPGGCDCVIPIEEVDIKGSAAVLHDHVRLKPGQNICAQGTDYKKKAVLLHKGCLLLSPQIAVAASVGKAKIKVSDKPKVAIISTGDEIVDIDIKIEPFQIRKSNSYFIKCALDQTNLVESKMFHFHDDKETLLEELQKILLDFNVLVFSGGISMGKLDYVPEVLEELGVTILLHKVKQKPGKPFLFGRKDKNRIIFALPGNPVSTQIGTYRYVVPYIRQVLGFAGDDREYAALSEDFDTQTDFTFFLPVQIHCNKDGKNEAKPVPFGGSGNFASLGSSDGFLELPPEKRQFQTGFAGRLYRWV